MQSLGQMYGLPPPQVSEVWVSGGAGSGQHGSVATKIRRFLAIDRNNGTGIRYVDSVTDGGLFIIQEDGWYSITYTDAYSAGNSTIGITVNDTNLTTDLDNITGFGTQIVATTHTGAANVVGSCSATIYLRARDIIRAHTQGVNNLTNVWQVQFRITKIR